MKIGILTYHRSINYGAQLQAFALQKYIVGQGHECLIIDYWPEYHKKRYKFFSYNLFCELGLRNRMGYLYFLLLHGLSKIKRNACTKKFVDDYLNITNNHSFDIAVYGSDQIWRKQHYKGSFFYNPTYFANEYISAYRKIAYAASMGSINVNETDKRLLRQYLSNFQGISVRETDLKIFLNKELNVDVQLVCDPVFLHSQDEWRKIVCNNFIPSYKYILYYRLQNVKILDTFVKELSRQTNLPVVELGSSMYSILRNKCKYAAGPIEFISLLSGADYVVTSSFHGLAFSIIFHKQFYVCLKDRISRVNSLLEKLNLINRTISQDNMDPVREAIDYNKVDSIKDLWIAQSKEWLHNQLGNVS